jgi:hypothetical protein
VATAVLLFGWTSGILLTPELHAGHEGESSMTRYTGLPGLVLAIISAAAGGQMQPRQAGQPGMQQPGAQQPGSQSPSIAPPEIGGDQNPAAQPPQQPKGNANQATGETGTNTPPPASDLAGQILTALHDDPTLANDQISVNVTDTDVVVSGTVGNGKEKETVKRIAESFATNRKVVDKVKVSGSKNTRSDQTRPN